MSGRLFFLGAALGVAYSVLGLPQPPESFHARAGDGRVWLEWAMVPGATHYTVKRSGSAAGALTVIATDLADARFEETGLRNGVQLFYAVSAVDGDGSGPDTVRLRVVP